MILQSTLTPNATPAASAAKKQTPISNPEYAAQLRELRAALSDLSEQMNDPMLGPSPTKASKQQR